MKPKTIITVTLLLFVAASVLYLVIKETGGKAAQSTVPPSMTSSVSGEDAQASARPPNKPEATKVVAYYFHGNMRCTTCRTIEAYTKEAVQTGFADALRDGRLEWRVVNVEDPGNDHFIQDFQLSTRSVVLERLLDGKRQNWKNLDRVWVLVRGDKAAFMEYIQDNIRGYLEAASK